MDMRGTGKSYPLDCNRTPTRLVDRLYRYSDIEFNRQCLLQIEHHGGLGMFSKQAIALDYEWLRKEIGAPTVYVVAEGRGVDVALAWATLNPHAIKRMVLDSPQTDNVIEYAQQTADVMQSIDQPCGKTELCRQLSLAVSFKKIHDMLPLSIAATDPITHQKTSLLLTKEAFTYSIINVLRTPKRSRYLAYVLSAASHHDWQPLIGLIGYAWTKRDVDFNVGLGMANQCNMYVQQPFKHDAHLGEITSRIYASEHRRLASLCKPLTKFPAQVFNKNSMVHTPALVLTGEASPMVKRHLPSLANQINIRVAGAGQYLLMYGCAKDVVYRYFKLQDTPTNKPIIEKQLDASCLTNIPYPTGGYTEFSGAKRD
jgi:pimeloyl-ACP methyl ester carboxylesterase